MFISYGTSRAARSSRGCGATVALPFLDAMTPAGTLCSQQRHRRPVATAMEMVHGAAGSTTFGIKNNMWAPAQVGSTFDLSPTA